jgi:integrase
MNKYLKDIGKDAKINNLESTSITKGGMRVDKTYKKYELITVHTARRSFATNMFLNDVPTISIMKITGHKTEKNFLKYIRISPEENAKKLAEHPYFQKPSNLKIVK